MSLRTLLCTIFLLLSALSLSAQDSRGPRVNGPSFLPSSAVSGSVRTADNQPARDARVELIDVRSGQVIASTYTTQGGTFDFINIADGAYEVSVVAGLEEVRDRVNVHGGSGNLTLRMARPASAGAGTRTSVSVAQLQVPRKARKAYDKAQSAIAKQDLAAAARYVEEALALHPEYSEALTLRGVLHLDAGKIEAACQDFDRAIKADNSYSTAYFALGAAYNVSSRFDDALRTIDRGLALAPNSWQAYFEMGKAFLGKGSYDAAVRQLNKAQTLVGQKDYPLLHLVKAHALLGLKNYPEAMAELQWYIDKAPLGDRNSVAARQMLDKVRAFAAVPPGK